MAVAGLHLYVFLSSNLNFYACRSKMLNAKQTGYACRSRRQEPKATATTLPTTNVYDDRTTTPEMKTSNVRAGI